MASSTLGSLGLGSEVLTTETLEKLKAADESSRLTPYTTKIETNTAKQTALTELTTKLSSFQSAVNSLADSTAFGKRKVTASVTGDTAAATLTASNGVSVQNLSVSVSQIAQKDVYQSKGLTGSTDRVLTGSQNTGTFTIHQGDNSYKISVEANTTYEDLVSKINDASDGKIVAKIVSTGEKGTPYRMTLSSKDTGAENAITFEADSDGQAILSNLGWNLKTTNIAVDDMQGYSYSGGTTASGITNLNDTITDQVNLTFVINGTKKHVGLAAGSTYQELIDQIKTQTGDLVNLTATSSSNGYIFNFTKGGNATSSETIKIFDGILDTTDNTYTSDSATSTLLSDTLKISLNKSYGVSDDNGDYHLKKAQDAIFTLDGVKMYRSSNSVSDIGTGLTLNILKAGDINFDVAQDGSEVTTAMETLVESYNELMNYLSEATAYNSETGTSGDLANVNEIKSLKSDIIKMLFGTKSVEGTTTDENGNKSKANVLVSVIDYGLTLNDSGLLTFDSSTFESKFAEDPEFAESFFSGTTGFEEVNVRGSAVKLDSDIDFKNQEFKLVYGDNSYDITKTADGKSDFTLTGATEEERMKNLLDHLNSFGISGLKISINKVAMSDGSTGYSLQFKSDDGSDFAIEGDKTFLEKLGLKEQKISPEVESGEGIFSSLKDTIKSYTKSGSSDTDKGVLTLYSERLASTLTSLQENKTAEQERIDTYYEIMYNKWVQYDSIIGNIKTQGEAISNMIEASKINND